jgi:hypothetical protein
MVEDEAIKQYLFKKKVDIFFVFVAVFAGIFFGWNMPEIVVFGAVVWLIMNPAPSRYMAFLALCFLSVTPFFLIFGKHDIAEQLAIYAYYFLVMSVIMGIYEIWQENGKKKEEVK